tara:strand:- start:139485 stop:139907 length:423 start_codon:yes stop_codon:yes gene_type:complete
MTNTTLTLPIPTGWKIIENTSPSINAEATVLVKIEETDMKTAQAVANAPVQSRFSNFAELQHFWNKREYLSEYLNHFILFPGVPVRCTGYVPEACVSGEKGFLAMICKEDHRWSVKAIPSMDDLSEHARGATIRIAVLHE